MHKRYFSNFLILFFVSLNFLYSQQKREYLTTAIDKLGEETSVNIPVVFHFIHHDYPNDNFTKEFFIDSLKSILKQVNKNFNDVDTSQIELPFRKLVAKTKINFYLAEKDENCEKMDFIDWHRVSQLSYTPFLEGNIIKSYGYKNSNKYLNIWICNFPMLIKKKAGGYTTSIIKPNIDDRLDGIVLDVDAAFTEGNTWLFTHEIGHWLGLEHIWGSSGFWKGMVNSTIYGTHNCKDDDGIADTPKQKGPHEKTNIAQVSCSGGLTNYQNFMDYSVFYGGMFTKNQKTAMRNYIYYNRPNLISGIICDDNINTDNPILEKKEMDRPTFYSFMIKSLNLEYKEDKFLKEYLQRTRKVNPKNEFEKQRLLSEVKSEIAKNISQFNYQNKFYLDYNTSLGKYSFDSKKFTLKLPKTLYDIGYYHLFDDFKIIGRDASSFGGFEMYAANFKDFKEIPISESEAENFLNKFSNRRIYCTIEFSLLKTPLMGTGMGRNKVVGMFGHISKVYIYSDKERTKLVKTLSFTNSKKYYESFRYGMFNKNSPMSSKIDFSFFNN